MRSGVEGARLLSGFHYNYDISKAGDKAVAIKKRTFGILGALPSSVKYSPGANGAFLYSSVRGAYSEIMAPSFLMISRARE